MNRHVAWLIHISRSLLRYWGVGLLNIGGLAIGFSAVLVIALYARDELTYDRFLPDAGKVYLLTAVYGAPGKPLVNSDKTPAGMARWLRTDSKAVDTVARLHEADASLRSDRYEAMEHFFWTDDSLFSVLKISAIHGNLATALTLPDRVVLTQRKARLYFGHDDVVGKTLTLNGSVKLTVTAILADLPRNTHLSREIFVSGKGGYSMLSSLDYNPDWLWESSFTYVRLRPGGDLGPAELSRIAARNWVGDFARPVRMELVSLPDLHFRPEADSQMKPRGHRDTVYALIAVAGLILVQAIVNVTGLTSAQLGEREGEMAVRSALGARAHHLLIQVAGETSVMTLLAMAAALAITERLLPFVNAQLGIELALMASPDFFALLAGGLLATGVISGLYPALRLSGRRHGRDIDRDRRAAWSYFSRVGWVAVQSCLLIILLVSAHTVQRQSSFAMGDALNFDPHGVTLITVAEGKGQDVDFKSKLLAIPGVEGATRSRFVPVYRNIRPGWLTHPTGQVVQFTRESVDIDFFRFYRIRLLAGTTFSETYSTNEPPHEVIINSAALKAFGYATPQAAIGRTISYRADDKSVTSSIIGVVDSIRTATVRDPLTPMVFDSQAQFFTVLSVRVSEHDQAQTLAAIDRLWHQDFPAAGPVDRRFFTEYLQDQYRDMLQQWRVFGLLSLVGICLNVLGLSGLSIYLARARLREIAIRNALGARFLDMVRLRLAPLVAPLTVAILAAGLVSWLALAWWLQRFSAHVDLSPFSLLAAAAFTVAITVLTLVGHTLLTSPAHSSQPRAD